MTTGTKQSSSLPSLADIRKTCALVTSHAKHIHLNPDTLTNFASTITTPPEHWLTTNPHNLLTLSPPLLVTVLLYFEAIDYSFWPDPPDNKWHIETPAGPLDGSIALLHLLIRNFQQNPDLDFSTFTDTNFYHFFHPNIPNPHSHTNNPTHTITSNISKISRPVPEIPLLASRATTLRETSRILRDKLNNNFYAATKNFTTDEQLFHFLITTFPSFRDQRTYTPITTPTTTTPKPHTIHFYKLAQLLTSDLLFIRHHLENITVDTSHLPGCADYKIPQTLRALGLISYDNELSKIVDTQQLIPENSPYEVEIRAVTISAIDFLHQLLPHFTSIQINDYIFLASRNLERKQPYHLTRNINY